MSSDFVKVYPGFFEGSLRDQPPYARLLFLAMLAKANQHGVVLGTPGFWSAYVGITVSEVQASLLMLSSPDPDSTTPDEDGRRIVPYGDGANRWRIVNYDAYYQKGRSAERAEYKREWDRAHADTRHGKKTRQDPTTPANPAPKAKAKGKERDVLAVSGAENSPTHNWEAFLAAYPKRSGDRKTAKGKAIFERITKNGVACADVLAGVHKYAAFCLATGKTGTEYVQQIPTWLNGKAWLEPFELPEDDGPHYRDAWDDEAAP